MVERSPLPNVPRSPCMFNRLCLSGARHRALFHYSNWFPGIPNDTTATINVINFLICIAVFSCMYSVGLSYPLIESSKRQKQS